MAAFALDLDHDGIRLLRQNGADWEELDRAPLDAPDLADRMQSMQATAAQLAEGLLETELIIPPSQILYTVLPEPEGRVDKAHVAAALDGLTPCPVNEMVFDWQRVPGGLAVAALDVNTLDEAESFAVTYGFNPVRFTALPGTEDFPGQPDFGPTQFVRQEAWLAKISVPDEPVEPDDEPVENLFVEDPDESAGSPPPITVIRQDQRLRVEDIPTESPTADGGPAPVLAAPRRATTQPRTDVPPRDWRRIGVTTAVAATVITGLLATAVYLVTPDDADLAVADVPGAGPEAQPEIAVPAAQDAGGPASAVDTPVVATERAETPETQAEEAPGAAPVTVTAAPAQAPVALPDTDLARLAPAGDPPSGAVAPARLRAPLTGPVAPRLAEMRATPEGPVRPPVRRHAADRLTPALPSTSSRIAPERMAARAHAATDGPGALAEDRSVLPPGWLRSTDFWQTPPPTPPDPVGETIDQLYLAAIDPQVAVDDAFALPEVPTVHDAPVIATRPPEQGRVFSLDGEGRVVATPEGAETPDGVVVTRGRPGVLPPTRPVIALAALSPEMAEAVAGREPRPRPDNLRERFERALYGGRTEAEMAALLPRTRPASDQERALQAQVRPRARWRFPPRSSRPNGPGTLSPAALRRSRRARPRSSPMTLRPPSPPPSPYRRPSRSRRRPGRPLRSPPLHRLRARRRLPMRSTFAG